MNKYCEKCGCYFPAVEEKCPACGYNKETEIKHDKFLEATYMDIYEKTGGSAFDQFVYDDWYGNGDIAEKLIANGVTVRELDGCKYCKEYEDLPEHFIDGKPVGRVFDTCIQTDENGRWHIEVPSGADIGIKFCPMCGRRLPQPTKEE